MRKVKFGGQQLSLDTQPKGIVMAFVSNRGLNPEQLLMALWNAADKNTHGPRAFMNRFPYTPTRFTLAQLTSKSFGDFDGPFYDGIVKALSLRPEDFKRDSFGNLSSKTFDAGSYDHRHAAHSKKTAAAIVNELVLMNRVS